MNKILLTNMSTKVYVDGRGIGFSVVTGKE